MNGNRIDIVPSLYLLSDLVAVRAVTPVHVGVGRVGGVVDLPVQRDEYSYPCIYSSSLKGALKTALLQAFLRASGDYSKARMAVQALLGPEPEEGETFESSIAILDAYLFAIPVRSLRSVYAYVTSPLLLRRFCERLELLATNSQLDDQQEKQVKEIIKTIGKVAEIEPEPSEAVCIGKDEECEKLRVSALQGKIVLADEYFLDVKRSKDITDDQVKMMNNFIENVIELDKPLLVINDKDGVAKSIVERGILRFTRVRLMRETKTVEEGPWTEEYLPPKAVLHTVALYKKPSLSNNFVKRVLGKSEQGPTSEDEYFEALKSLQLLNNGQVGSIKSSSKILEKMQLITRAIREKTRSLIVEQLKEYLILGGHETIGKGIAEIRVLSSEELLKKVSKEGT